MYKGRYFVRETVYVCGDYLDAAVYPVFQPAGKRRRRCRPTRELQKKLNQRNAELKFTRLVHNNFTEQDLAMHLTYQEEPEDIERAQKNLRNFMLRIKRLRKRLGLEELRYVSCTEYGKRTGRIHHHLILSGDIDRDQLEKLWGLGYANTKRLQFGEDGVTGLSHYIVKDHNRYKRWNQSRNLVIPEPMVSDGRLGREDVKEMQEAIEQKTAHDYFEAVYPDFELIEAVYTKNEINQGDYVLYKMRRRRNRRAQEADPGDSYARKRQ